jgi:tetratricopeptide (TPR) repeat protein
MLLADGRLAVEGGVYRPTGPLDDLAVPETLSALIASRLDGLEPADRALLLDAAVLGQSFTLAGLAVVSGVAESDVEARLTSLLRREFVSLQADPRSPERGQYAFVQALIREVAYNMLARPDRKVRHLAAARYFEALGSDELAGALAGHYLAAYLNAAAGPERDALGGQARIALRAAADRATALGAHEQALRFYEQALTVATDPADAADLHQRACESAGSISHTDDATRHFRAAMEILARLQDESGQARITASYARALLRVYLSEEALALTSEASERFADRAEDPAVVGLNAQLARAHFLAEGNAKAIEVADRVLAVAERLDLVDVVADTLVTRGGALANEGRRYEGIGAIEAGQRLAVAHSLHRTVLRALNNLASFLMDSDPRAALEAAREGLLLAQRLGERMFQIMDNGFTGAIRTGEWDWAAAQLEPMLRDDIDASIRAVAITDTVVLRASRGEPTDRLIADLDALPTRDGDPVKPTTMSWSRAWVAFASGRFDEARTQILASAATFPANAPECGLLAARCDLMSGDADRAVLDMVAVDASPRRGRAIDADRATIRAGIAALLGRTDEALGGYREALAAWRDLGLVWDEALCAIDMATLLEPAIPEVKAAAEAARRTLVRLGARPFVERLDAAMSRPGSVQPAEPLEEATGTRTA